MTQFTVSTGGDRTSVVRFGSRVERSRMSRGKR